MRIARLMGLIAAGVVLSACLLILVGKIGFRRLPRLIVRLCG
jgi:hypothetical protein